MLRQVFQIPSLHRLCVDLAAHLEPGYIGLLPGNFFLDPEGEILGLQIQDLSWTGCPHAINALTPVIRSLRKLKRLACCEQRRDDRDTATLGFTRALQSKKEILKELVLHEATKSDAHGLSTIFRGQSSRLQVDLRKFTALKRLSFDSGLRSEDWISSYIYLALPLQLEMLEIRMTLWPGTSSTITKLAQLHNDIKVILLRRSTHFSKLKAVVCSID